MYVNCPPPVAPITIRNEPLCVVENFKYLGSRIVRNNDATIEVKSRISAASVAFGRLYTRVWKQHNLSLGTKLTIYKTIVLSTLLYGSETWTIHQKHVRELNSFHMKCLRSITRTDWRDRVPNEAILEKTNMDTLDEILRVKRLRWAGHVSRMPSERIPHQIAFSQLSEGVRPQVVKDDMKKCNIDVNAWRTLAADRTKWRDTIQSETIKLHKTNIEEKKQKRTARHAEEEKFDWKCPLCNFTRTGRTGRQYVASHLSQKHPREMEECRRNRSLKCTMCNFEARSLSGLQSHTRNKHPTFQSRNPKPIRLRAATTSTTGSVPPPLPPPRDPHEERQ
ncbi:hypothetical protein M8J77_005084 [Diaphorina citri]|nr:hypothetical protein M8J77_005084 [Diaphorina citri]